MQLFHTKAFVWLYYLFFSFRVWHCCEIIFVCLLHGEKHVPFLEEDVPELVEVGVALQPQLVRPPRSTNANLVGTDYVNSNINRFFSGIDQIEQV